MRVVRPQHVAMYLKLKEGAKGVWAVQMLAGFGYQPILWNAELTGMRFSKNQQHISIYNGNNNGHTADEELMKHYDTGAAALATGGMLSVTQPDIPDIEKKRYTDNSTHSISTNQLVKLKELELTTNINFYNEQLDKEGRSLFTQYLPNAATPLVIEEITENTSKENNLNVSLGVQQNKELIFFRNRLNIRTSWNRTFTNLADGKTNTAHQHLDNPYFSVDNELSMMKRVNNHLFRIHLDVAYKDCPHLLRITPAFYFSPDSLKMLSQQVEQKYINANLHTSYGVSLGRFTLNYTPKISIDLRKLTSGLTGNDWNNNFISAADSVRNDLWYNHYQIGIDQDYTYKQNNKLRVRLLVPVYLSVISNNDCLADNSTNCQRLVLTPSLMADYSISQSFKTVASAYYHKSYGSMDDAYKGYILQSYRNLLRNSTDRLFENSGSGGQLGIEYRNVIRMFFLNIGGSYQHGRKNLLYGYDYDGIVGTKSTINQPTESDYYKLYVTSSKGIKFWQTKFELLMGMNSTRSDLLLQNIIQPFHTNSYTAGGVINTTPCRFFNLSYNFAWLKIRQWVTLGDEKLPSMQTYSHNAKVWMFPSKKLSINLNFDYHHNDQVDNSQMFFMDATVKYSNRQVEWEFESANLFDVRCYMSSSYSNMGTYISSYQLRPRNFLFNVRFKLK